jgi:hypothetical protein
MCAMCSSISVPACAISGSCGAALAESVKMVALGATPVIGGVSVWLQSKVIRKRVQRRGKKK